MSANDENQDRQLGLRINQALYDRIVKKQQEAKRLTGFEPSLSEVARQLIECGLKLSKRRR
jgi:hypothetical protein